MFFSVYSLMYALLALLDFCVPCPPVYCFMAVEHRYQKVWLLLYNIMVEPKLMLL
jgi:hypothetical protein